MRRRDPQRGGIISKLIFLFCLAAFLGLLYFLRHPILRGMGEYWVVDDGPARSDAILILGDDNERGDRATRAADLFRQGWAPVIVASGRYLRPHATIAELIAHDLEERGIPPAAIVRFPHHGDNTREEAAELRRLIAERGWKRVLIVTSNYHTRRARYICRRVLAGTELRMIPANDYTYDPRAWWQNRLGVKLFFNETVGICVAWWELRNSGTGTALLLAAAAAPGRG